MRNKLILSIIILVLFSSIVSAITLRPIPLDSNGKLQPNKFFIYTINLSRNISCTDIILSSQKNFTTNEAGVGFIQINTFSLTDIPTYLCEYRGAVPVLKNVSKFSDLILNSLRVKNIYAINGIFVNIFKDGEIVNSTEELRRLFNLTSANASLKNYVDTNFWNNSEILNGTILKQGDNANLTNLNVINDLTVNENIFVKVIGSITRFVDKIFVKNATIEIGNVTNTLTLRGGAVNTTLELNNIYVQLINLGIAIQNSTIIRSGLNESWATDLFSSGDGNITYSVGEYTLSFLDLAEFDNSNSGFITSSALAQYTLTTDINNWISSNITGLNESVKSWVYNGTLALSSTFDNVIFNNTDNNYHLIANSVTTPILTSLTGVINIDSFLNSSKDINTTGDICIGTVCMSDIPTLTTDHPHQDVTTTATVNFNAGIFNGIFVGSQSELGIASGAAGAKANQNILLYDNAENNWAGITADAGGNMAFNTGLGTRFTPLKLRSVTGTVEVGNDLDIAGDIISVVKITTALSGFQEILKLISTDVSGLVGAVRFSIRHEKASFIINAYSSGMAANLQDSIGFFADGNSNKLIIGHTSTAGSGKDVLLFTSNQFNNPQFILKQDGNIEMTGDLNVTGNILTNITSCSQSLETDSSGRIFCGTDEAGNTTAEIRSVFGNSTNITYDESTGTFYYNGSTGGTYTTVNNTGFVNITELRVRNISSPYVNRSFIFFQTDGSIGITLDPVIILQDADSDNLNDDDATGSGSDSVFYATGSSNSGFHPAGIMFNISSPGVIPTGQQIDEAILYLYVTAVSGSTNTQIFEYDLHTWNEEDGISSKEEIGSLLDTFSDATSDTWVNLNVTSWVSSEYDGGQINVSFALNDSGTSPWASFRTKEYASVEHRPYLNITYSALPLPPKTSKFFMQDMLGIELWQVNSNGNMWLKRDFNITGNTILGSPSNIRNITMFTNPSGNPACCGVMDDMSFGCTAGVCA